ncbi:MAG: transposase, partial [Thiotrichales bacterium]
MPKPRKAQVSLASTPYYHCVSRCVRRAFLCGKDSASSRSFEHRRKWVEDRLHELAGIFAIDLCGYAVMSNHYHVILHIDQTLASEWTAQEVIEQWHQLFTGNLLSQRYQLGERLSAAESTALSECVEEWRARLMDISWFMRVLNEGIARQANAEDECSGR